MSRRKPLAVLAAVTAAAAVVVPAANASAATTARSASTRFITPVPYTPPAFLCSALVLQLRGAEAVGNPLLANLIGQTLFNIGCGGAAI